LANYDFVGRTIAEADKRRVQGAAEKAIAVLEEGLKARVYSLQLHSLETFHRPAHLRRDLFLYSLARRVCISRSDPELDTADDAKADIQPGCCIHFRYVSSE
jgi:hypothetical protein